MSRIEINRVPAANDRSLPVFSEFDRLADRIRMHAFQLFQHRGGDGGHALDDWLTAEREFCWPAAELTEDDDEYSLKVALAGFEPKDISVTATPCEIVVKARHEHRRSRGEGEGELKWSEFRSDDVFRRVELPTNIVVDEVSASLKNGMLEVKARKLAATAAGEEERKIELSTPA